MLSANRWRLFEKNEHAVEKYFLDLYDANELPEIFTDFASLYPVKIRMVCGNVDEIMD